MEQNNTNMETENTFEQNEVIDELLRQLNAAKNERNILSAENERLKHEAKVTEKCKNNPFIVGWWCTNTWLVLAAFTKYFDIFREYYKFQGFLNKTVFWIVAFLAIYLFFCIFYYVYDETIDWLHKKTKSGKYAEDGYSPLSWIPKALYFVICVILAIII